MITEILAIFDQALSEKCWIENYGRLAIAGKQKIGDKWRRFPLSTQVITSECEDLTPYLTTLVPDDTKKGVAFWKALTPLVLTKIPGISANRRLKRADITLQFVCWINVRKASGVNDSSNWATVIDSIVKDAWKTIDCRNPNTPTGITGINNLTIEAVSVGEIEAWRAAMSDYTIDKLEALTIWPFAGFTITCKVSFITKADCFEAFDCSTEFDATGFCPPAEPELTIRIDRNASAGEMEGYPHYFPLSMLPDAFWNETDGVLRVIDNNGHEVPCEVVGIDIPGKTGSLFFKTTKSAGAGRCQIVYTPGMAPYSPSYTLGFLNVWTGFDDIIFHDVTPSYLFKNHKYNFFSGLPLAGGITPLPGMLEMEVPEFGDGFISGISGVGWRSEFGEFSTPKTFFCAFKVTSDPNSTTTLIANYNWSIESVIMIDLLKNGGDYLVRIHTTDQGSNTILTTQAGQFTDFALDTWFVLAVKYEAGVTGVEIDINGTSRLMDSATGVYPEIGAFPIPTLFEPKTGAPNMFGLINQVWVYNGALIKAQRDIFWRNWSDPAGFWTVY